MKLATWTAAIVIGGGLAVLAVYWAVTVLTPSSTLTRHSP